MIVKLVSAVSNYSNMYIQVQSSIFSQLSITQYVGQCVFSLPFSLVMIERIYILCLIIIIKSEAEYELLPIVKG